MRGIGEGKEANLNVVGPREKYPPGLASSVNIRNTSLRIHRFSHATANIYTSNFAALLNLLAKSILSTTVRDHLSCFHTSLAESSKARFQFVLAG